MSEAKRGYRAVNGKFTPKYRSIKDMDAKDVGNQMWLTIDDTLRMLPISRALLWKLIDEDRFPVPYKHNNRIIWTKAEIEDELKKICEGRAEPEQDKTPVTWDAVKRILSVNIGLTNREITERLNADSTDVSHMTRLMTKAGELDACTFYNGTTSPSNPRIFMLARGGK